MQFTDVKDEIAYEVNMVGQSNNNNAGKHVALAAIDMDGLRDALYSWHRLANGVQNCRTSPRVATMGLRQDSGQPPSLEA